MKTINKNDYLSDIKCDIMNMMDSFRIFKYEDLEYGTYQFDDIYRNLEDYKKLQDILNKINILQDLMMKEEREDKEE